MDFFEHQASARRQTGRLLVFFLAAVGLTVLAVDLGVFVLASWMGMDLLPAGGSPLWHSQSLPAVFLTVLTIVFGSLREYFRLRGGGRALAESLGARRIDFATTELRERQFINVVSEMSIASGVPMPALYVLDSEPGINAFVAGLTLDQTVMVVTGGALETFDRNELQAVAGHEFSHILNGDMRLNLRLLALLAGILAIGQVGGFFMRLAADTGGRRRRSHNDKRGGVIHVFFLGLLLWLVGAIGLFFGRLIKAAISRQREFLADASSVQFTRNPDGLASALLKIRDATAESWLQGGYADKMSHMCFAETLSFSALLATHPPLDERIAILGKHYLVRDRARQRARRHVEETAADVAGIQGLPPPAAGMLAEDVPLPGPRELAPIPFDPVPAGTVAALAVEAAVVAAGATAATAPVRLVARAGTVNPAELASAQALLRRLPPAVLQGLETCEGAQALLYALTARHCTAPAAAVQQFLATEVPALAARAGILYRVLEGLDLSFSLPLVELALPRLQLLAPADLRALMERLQRLAQLDQRLSTFEFALLVLLRKQLQLLPAPRPVKLAQCAPAIAVVVATLLRAGGMRGEVLERTFPRLLRTVVTPPPALPAAADTGLGRLARLLHQFRGLSLAERKTLLELAATAVLADAEVRIDEYELLRVVAGMLDCPMPVLEA